MKIKKISNGYPQCEDCKQWKLQMVNMEHSKCSNCGALYEILDWEDDHLK